ncbi:MAG: 16S rRNA (adenine(1518)-N(6)/adenine(1519)-N(6))-dimethyltransferase RsmA [Actinobacteria bacterium]|nr:MAG: 16S rRNA (adenine(1518)-N(6)/adenine(1519)-N(6))-dimethyltransferase RsmA [Actinomycetota bacterium]
MTEDRSRRDASSTSHPRPSRPFPRSDTGSSRSRSAGRAGGLGAAELRDLADRHGIAPRRSLGQHFLLDPNVARAIVRDAGIGPGDRVIEIGAGLGSLTLALDASGADVVAVELDPGLVSALADVLQEHPRVRVVRADAMRSDWDALLGSDDVPWILCANLPYNIATPLVLDVLARVPKVVRSVVMMQREVGERLAARPGDDAYGAVSVRVAYRALASTIRRVPPEVFWPRPKVESVVVRLDRLSAPPVDVDEDRLWRVVDGAFAQRRKTMRNALRRLGLEPAEADATLAASGVAASARPEELSLEDFARVASAMPA